MTSDADERRELARLHDLANQTMAAAATLMKALHDAMEAKTVDQAAAFIRGPARTFSIVTMRLTELA